VNKRHALSVVILSAFCSFYPAHADVTLNGLFADHMVLQRGAKVPVWGTATPGEQVTVTFGSQTVTSATGPDGKWRVNLNPMPANSTPAELTAVGKNTLKVQDVLVGDVWLCSGQSNMELRAGGLKDHPLYKDDISSANLPELRLSFFTKTGSETPLDSVSFNWTACTPDTVVKFSAAGFYFGRDLQKELKVPIGLLCCTWGGTSAEVWTSLEALNKVPSFKQRAAQQIEAFRQIPEFVKTFPGQLAAWEKKYGRADTENLGEKQGWAKPETSTADWKPGKFNLSKAALGTPDGGIVWVRKEITIPETAAGKGFHVITGKANGQFVTFYFNGKKIGESGHNPPLFYMDNAGTAVPADLIKAGANVIGMRIVSDSGTGSYLNSKPGKWDMNFPGAGDLTDDCQFKVEKQFSKLTQEALAEKPAFHSMAAQGVSSYLFNGMIHPLIPFALKGVVWYQGENDASRGHAYRTLLPTLITDWRQRWGQGDFPVLIQQLPNYHGDMNPKVEWAELREAEAMTASNLPNCGLACAIDIGEGGNVHPLNKRDIGRRLSLVALAKFYGQKVDYSGPVFASMIKEGPAIRVKFSFDDGLKSSNGQPLTQFAIAGSDKNFVPAEARIDGNTVVISSPQIKEPVAVRYAWADNPEGLNFINASGLPAFPFRTDDWPGITDNNP